MLFLFPCFAHHSSRFECQSAVEAVLLDARSSDLPRLTPVQSGGTGQAVFLWLYFFGGADGLLAEAGSTPKSQTKRFMPSGSISARAYSPGGSGSPSVNR